MSLAHRGVLFLDELPEFPKQTGESLRQPMESGRTTVAHASAHITYPARFQLVAADSQQIALRRDDVDFASLCPKAPGENGPSVANQGDARSHLGGDAAPVRTLTLRIPQCHERTLRPAG